MDKNIDDKTSVKNSLNSTKDLNETPKNYNRTQFNNAKPGINNLEARDNIKSKIGEFYKRGTSAEIFKHKKDKNKIIRAEENNNGFNQEKIHKRNILLNSLSNKTAPLNSTIKNNILYETYKRRNTTLEKKINKEDEDKESLIDDAELNLSNLLSYNNFESQNIIDYSDSEPRGIDFNSPIQENKKYIHDIPPLGPLITQLMDFNVSAENLGLYHGDINPNNIFLDENNNVKVGDFGQSDSLEIVKGKKDLKTSRAHIYQAPEVYRESSDDNIGKETIKMNTYSIAMVILELLSYEDINKKTHEYLAEELGIKTYGKYAVLTEEGFKTIVSQITPDKLDLRNLLPKDVIDKNPEKIESMKIEMTELLQGMMLYNTKNRLSAKEAREKWFGILEKYTKELGIQFKDLLLNPENKINKKDRNKKLYAMEVFDENTLPQKKESLEKKFLNNSSNSKQTAKEKCLEEIWRKHIDKDLEKFKTDFKIEDYIEKTNENTKLTYEDKLMIDKEIIKLYKFKYAEEIFKLEKKLKLEKTSESEKIEIDKNIKKLRKERDNIERDVRITRNKNLKKFIPSEDNLSKLKENIEEEIKNEKYIKKGIVKEIGKNQNLKKTKSEPQLPLKITDTQSGNNSRIQNILKRGPKNILDSEKNKKTSTIKSSSLPSFS